MSFSTLLYLEAEGCCSIIPALMAFLSSFLFYFTSSCRGCAVFGEPVLSSSGQSGWPQFGRWWCSLQLSFAWIVVWKKRVQSLFSRCGLRLYFPASLVSEASLWQQKGTQSLGLCRQEKPGVCWMCPRAGSTTNLIKFAQIWGFR